MALPPSLEVRLRRLALDNAVHHEGEARPGPLVSRLLASDPALRSHSSELHRLAISIATEVTAMDRSAQERALSALGGPEPSPVRAPSTAGELPPLAEAIEGHVVLRMAPFPSGALHIGNARMIFINEAYRRRYKGQLLLVLDDTVGSEEKRVETEFFDLILRDLERSGVTPDATYYKSDRIPRHYEWAARVIDSGAAYVCVCPADLLRENRKSGSACPERAQSVETTRADWQKMLSGAFAPGEAVLRLKTDLQDPDPAFRDRVLLRISDFDHPRVGHRYRVWPMLEFSWAVDDIELGITHVIRGKDLVIEDRMQEYIWRVLGIAGPHFLHWGILRVREAKVAKSKAYAEVKSGLYDGWADPRTWSLQSLDRRGITVEAIRRFTLSFGLSLADIEVPAETLYAENRTIIDATTPRRLFVPDPRRVHVDGYPTTLGPVVLPNHPDRTELGTRVVTTGPDFWLPGGELVKNAGMEIRLKDLLNLELPQDLSPGADAAITAKFTSKENKRLPRIQWVGVTDSVPVDILDIDGTHRSGLGEGALRTASPADRLQFERVGFVRVELDWPAGTTPLRVCYGHP
ncbi:MAG: glutamate--tRNA ligase [Thermoplasmata archaeon]|nr:glutamate--tRNA ligase [Thermoplasmata archaeon]